MAKSTGHRQIWPTGPDMEISMRITIALRHKSMMSALARLPFSPCSASQAAGDHWSPPDCFDWRARISGDASALSAQTIHAGWTISHWQDGILTVSMSFRVTCCGSPPAPDLQRTRGFELCARVTTWTRSWPTALSRVPMIQRGARRGATQRG